MDQISETQKNALSKNPRPKVLINASDVPQKGLDLLSEKCDLIMCSNNYPRSEILEKVRGVDGIFWKGHYYKLDKEIIEAAGENLRIVATMTSGYNHIDTEELKCRKIALAHTSEVVNSAVADLAVLLVLAAARRLHEARLSIETGNWPIEKTSILGHDLRGSTVGIIGFGGIGQAIARRIKAFEVKSILYNSRTKKSSTDNAEFVDLNRLLQDSDFVIVSAPLTEETQNLCNEDFFNRMKQTSVFVNVSRGLIVDQKALIKALKNGRIFAAGLDAMTPEPLPEDDELLTLPNCVLTPHLGCATIKTFEEMSCLTALNILKGIAGEPLISPVFEF